MRQILSLIGKSVRAIGRAFGIAGRATVALVGICGVVAALANYTMTQGAGTTFGSIVVSTVHYAQMLICDPTTPANCGAVKAGNAAGTTDVAQVVTDPNVLAAVQAPVPAGTNLIGKVGIDQTTPGTTNGVQVNAALPTGTNSIGSVTMPDTRPASGNITIQDTGSASASGQNSVSIITGTPTAASFYTQAINGQSTARIQVSGTWTGTLTIEGSVDGGTTYVAHPALDTGTVFTTSTFKANGQFTLDASGLTHVRIRATAAMTGTAVAVATFGVDSGTTNVLNPLRIYDNTSGAQATVKAASTPAAASDTAIVVDQRPGTIVSASPGTLALGGTFVKGTTAAMTATTSTQIIAAVASQRIYSTRVSCKGDPANAVGTKVQIQDGSGGSVLDTMTVAASGGGEQATSSTPLHWTTSGNGLFAQNVTTGASVICTASGYSG